MSRSKSAWIGIAAVGALITLSVSAQQYQAPPPQQAPMQAPIPQGGGTEFFAPNLGIYYRLVPYNAYNSSFNPVTGNYDPSNPPSGGYAAPAPAQVPYPGTSSYGARLTRYPVANSPAAGLQLEPGDMIISLDNLAIYSPNDVRNHRFETSMVFVNVRTGLPQSANIYIP